MRNKHYAPECRKLANESQDPLNLSDNSEAQDLAMNGYIIDRRRFVQGGLLAMATLASAGVPSLLSAASGETWSFDPDQPIIPPPKDPALWPAFRARLSQWRQEVRQRLNYDDALYRKPEFKWAA